MICKLRKRMKDIDPSFKIETVWGSGYFIEPAIRTSIMSRLAAEAKRAKSA
jgi:DNA-binding winged helix-turn-helix (wHTH) protein